MNNTIFYFLYSFAHQSAFFDKVIIFSAIYFPFVVVALAGIFLLFHHEFFKAESPARVLWEKKKEFSAVFVSGFLAYLISVLLKVLIHTLRPFLALPNVQALFFESGFAFPSGHATFFSALAVSIFFLHKKAGYAFMIFALIIGLARIAAGVHFPLDILGGFILGTVISYSVAYFLKNIYSHT